MVHVNYIKWNKDPGSLVTIDYPPIIDMQTWNLAQDQRKNPTRLKIRMDSNLQATYMLKGILFGGNRGRRYTAESSLRTQYRTRKDGN